MKVRIRISLVLIAAALCLTFFVASPGQTDDHLKADAVKTIEVVRVGSQPSAKGKAEYFTGSVRIDPLVDATPPSRTTGGSVTFEPGARSAWHTQLTGRKPRS